MTSERLFVKDGIKKSYLEKFLAEQFSKAGYSHADIQRTPLSTRIVVHVERPGLVIGRGGKNIDMMTEAIKEKFGLENPQLDVREVEVPALDASIVAKQIAAALERGLNYKRIANIVLERVMGSGAAGVAIRIGGRLGGDKSRFEKFSDGYLKHAGDTAETLVDTSYAEAHTNPGVVGIQVRIMKELPKELSIAKKLEEEKDGGNKKEGTQ